MVLLFAANAIPCARERRAAYPLSGFGVRRSMFGIKRKTPGHQLQFAAGGAPALQFPTSDVSPSCSALRAGSRPPAVARPRLGKLTSDFKLRPNTKQPMTIHRSSASVFPRLLAQICRSGLFFGQQFVQRRLLNFGAGIIAPVICAQDGGMNGESGR
jgi:hypothetical protein